MRSSWLRMMLLCFHISTGIQRRIRRRRRRSYSNILWGWEVKRFILDEIFRLNETKKLMTLYRLFSWMKLSLTREKEEEAARRDRHWPLISCFLCHEWTINFRTKELKQYRRRERRGGGGVNYGNEFKWNKETSFRPKTPFICPKIKRLSSSSGRGQIILIWNISGASTLEDPWDIPPTNNQLEVLTYNFPPALVN